ncbi:hypothetical protein [Caulobacter sp. 17J80-11]|uniref:hypothetical protein n=1 Tax=Caulobacter sp. 17J80-11 TaxID=2763502 RepID=UPI00165374CD|nr:hypothetical protein [Caulobacter sp. 17J80-11]MBC6980519.1 hypothetical protein [Caulobacter sp. 17J80-11]
MKLRIGLAGLAAGFFACAVSAAEARPTVLADSDLDRTTAGAFDDAFGDRLSIDLSGFGQGDFTGGGTTIVNSYDVSSDGSSVVESHVAITTHYSIDN